jgi:hypothetical protein
MTSRDAELTEFWNIINDIDDQDKIADIISNLDEDTVNKLRSMKNPYQKPVYSGPDETRFLSFGFINLREKYFQRFAMTSLIGFIYRMLDEYEPASAKSFTSENSPEFAKLHLEKVAKLERRKPIETLQASLADSDAEISKLSNQLDESASAKSELGRAVKRRFVTLAQLNKHHHQKLIDKKKSAEESLRDAGVKVTEITRSIANIRELIPETEGRIDRKKKFDERMLEFKGNKNSDVIIQKIAPEFKLSPEDAGQPLASFEIELQNKRNSIAMLEVDLKEWEEKESAALSKTQTLATAVQQAKDEFDSLKSDYKSKFKLPSYSRHPLDSIKFTPYEATDSDLEEVDAAVKSALGIEKTAEEHTEEKQAEIQEFLDSYFVYNPDFHVSCAYKPNYDDPLRTPLEINEQQEIIEKEYERSVIPPDDTFYRLNRYVENNYEELRQATDDIYNEKSDFEVDIVPLEMFAGPDAEEEADAFDRKYSDEFEYDVLRARFNRHNLLGSFTANREKRKFFNENTEIIERIIEQSQKDQEMGKKMMKERAKQKKEENVREAGPYAKDLNLRQEQSVKELEKHGAKHVSEIVTKDDVPRDYEESTKDEVEVDVHEIKPRRRKGKRLLRGGATRTKFHLPVEKMKEGQVSVRTAAEVRENLSEKERKEQKKKRNE